MLNTSYSVSRSRSGSTASESESFSYDHEMGRHTHSKSTSDYGVSGKLTAGTGATSNSWSVTHSHRPLNDTAHVHPEYTFVKEWEVYDAPMGD